MKELFHFNPVTTNKKLGPVPVVTSSKETCPDSCPFKKNGCYAETGAMNIMWSKITDKNPEMLPKMHDIGGLCEKIKGLKEGTFWRFGQAGDLPGKNKRINKGSLLMLVAANKGRAGFAYTHKPVLGNSKLARHNREAVENANKEGFTINLSANNLANADELADLEVAPVAAVLPEGAGVLTLTPKGRKVLLCPAQQKGKNITCKDCKLCQRRDRKGLIIGFLPHGNGRKKVAKISA